MPLFSPCGCRCGGLKCVPHEDGDPTVLFFLCSPCDIPCRDLTLSWLNVLTGSGSTLLEFVSPGIWETECTNNIVFRLTCLDGSILFTATAYTPGTCPTGDVVVVCSSADGSLTVVTNCDPGVFILTYTPKSPGCSYLIARGYTRFTVTQ